MKLDLPMELAHGSARTFNSSHGSDVEGQGQNLAGFLCKGKGSRPQTILYYIIQHYVIFYYTILYYTIIWLCYILLEYTRLYYTRLESLHYMRWRDMI